MASATNADLTTAQLADRTGLTPPTLRMWETRYGFPQPRRLPGGHRRYTADDVAAVREVLRLRDDGLSLPAAIERLRRRRRPEVASVFAGLRRRRPDVPATVLAKPAVLALTRAIEDEYCARAADGVLIGAFQRERFYRAAQPRWRELARTARVAVALADFAAAAQPAEAPLEVPVDRHHPLGREWAVVVSAGDVQACLAAWEQPGQPGQRGQREAPAARRRFEVLWSFDPVVVADAVEVALELVRPLDGDAAERLAAAHDGIGAAAGPPLEYAGALAQRMIGYLGRLLDARAASPS